MVTIIIPVYQVEKYIEKCLESVCHQTFKDYEILVIDDGTKDGSVKIAETFLSNKNVNYKIIHKDNGGLSSARNRGIEESKGDYIAFVDSDDTIQNDYIEVLVNGFASKNVDASIGMWRVVQENTPPLFQKKDACYSFLKKREILNNFLYRKIKAGPCCVMYRKEFLIKNNLFFNEQIRFSEDQEFFWRVFSLVNQVAYTNRIIYDYYIRENSISTDPKIERIMSGYHAIVKIANKVEKENNICGKHIIGRWVLGTLHNTAKYCSIGFYLQLYDMLLVKENVGSLRTFKDKKIKTLRLICLISPVISYKIFRSVL